MEGWMDKRGRIGLKAWKHRFFKQSGTKLYYYTHDTMLKGQRKGFIDLQKINEITEVSPPGHFELQIHTPGRVYELRVTSEDERAKWIAALKTSNESKSKNMKVKEVPVRATNNVEDYYTVGEELGTGAFSVVKKAINKETGEKVAVKIIDKKNMDKGDLLQLASEIKILMVVDHPNVLKMIEAFENDEQITLVMELVEGGELFQKIAQKGNYSEQDASDIIRQVLKGVEYLHSHGICHRDLKPENLLCANNEDSHYKPFRVIIADFGLSKTFDGEDQLKTSAGTLEYAAPEVITSENEFKYDNLVDIWSLGVITYVLLCGFSPFLCSNQTGLYDKIIKCEYSFPDPEWTNITKNAKDLIKNMLVRDPKKRFTASECLEHPWIKEKNTNTEALGNGKIGEKMHEYNEGRKT